MQTDLSDNANIPATPATPISSFNEHMSHALLGNIFSHSIKAAIGNVVASLLIIFWLTDVANTTHLTIWFGALTLMSCFRLFLHTAYSRYSDNKNRSLWLHTWAGCSAIMGSIYGLGLAYFIPFEQAHYAVAVGLFIVALGTGSVMLFSASKYAALSFFVPLLLIPSFFLVSEGEQIGTMTAITLLCYSAALLLLTNNTSATFKKSITNSLQYQQEQEKRKRLEQQLYDVSRRDGLTGIFNRRYFDEMLDDEIGRAHRNHQPLCVLMFDIDCFELYNKQYGHIAGDTCLINIAEIASTLANRKGDLCARHGGEEFAIILPNIDLKGAVAFANKLQLEVQKKRIEHSTTKLTTLKCVTISIGVTNLMPFTKAKPNELIKHAEIALFEAKRQGRNRVHFNENNGLSQSASL